MTMQGPYSAAWKVAQRHADYRERQPFHALRYTAAQEAYMRDRAPVVLMRGGNQPGKTTITQHDLIHRCRGTHPFHQTHKPPINVVILSESWDQMGQAGGFQQKLWEALPKDEIDPKIKYEPGRGITGKPPRVVFTSGPGRGSVVTLATFRQGAARIAGGTVDLVMTDEPPPPSLITEIMPRLVRKGGHLRINFTPTLNMPPQDHLRGLVRSKAIEEHNIWLTEVNCWAQGAPFPWLSQGRIDEMVALLPEPVRRMRVEGSWEPLLTGRWLSNFDADRHVLHSVPPPGAMLGVGVDHGTAAGKQAAILFGAIGLHTMYPYVWFFDEVLSESETTPRQDAMNIAGMLKRNDLDWQDIDVWIGDRPTGESRYLVRKSNSELKRQLCAWWGIPLGKFPKKAPRRIETPNKKRSSVESGLYLMNAYAGTFDEGGHPHFIVHPRCERFKLFCEQFQGDTHDPLKDIGDAGRYVMQRCVQELPPMMVAKRRY